MRRTTTAMLAIVSLLTASATAMAASSSHRNQRVESREGSIQYTTRAPIPQLRYDPSTYAFEPTYGAGDTLFERAKGNIE